MPKTRNSSRLYLAALVLLGAILPAMVVAAPATKEQTIEELKARVTTTAIGDRSRLCIRIAERQLATADKLYGAVESEKAQAALADVVAYSETARDSAIQSRRRQKEAEIAVRVMVRKLSEIKHAVSREEQVPVQDAIIRLERVRDDLLAAMFNKGAK
jgi:hypothetical protein